MQVDIDLGIELGQPRLTGVIEHQHGIYHLEIPLFVDSIRVEERKGEKRPWNDGPLEGRYKQVDSSQAALGVSGE